MHADECSVALRALNSIKWSYEIGKVICWQGFKTGSTTRTKQFTTLHICSRVNLLYPSNFMLQEIFYCGILACHAMSSINLQLFQVKKYLASQERILYFVLYVPTLFIICAHNTLI